MLVELVNFLQPSQYPMKAISITLLLFCLTSFNAIAQPTLQLNWELFTGNQDIECIKYDEINDVLWYTTDLGLYRRTNNTLDWYNYENSGLPHWELDEFVIDLNGEIWIAGWNGLWRFDGSTLTYYDDSNTNLSSQQIKALDVDDSGVVWGLSGSSNIFSFDGVNWTHEYTSPPLTPNEMKVAPDGVIWFSTGSGLVSFDNGTRTTYSQFIGNFPAAECFEIGFDSNHTLWAGSLDGLVKKDSGGTFQLIPSGTQGIPKGAVVALEIDDNDIVWLAYDQPASSTIDSLVKSSGVVNYTDQVHLPYVIDDARYIGAIDFCLGNAGKFWLGTSQCLAEYVNGFNNISSGLHEFPMAPMLPFTAAGDEEVWMGIGGPDEGVFKFNRNQSFVAYSRDRLNYPLYDSLTLCFGVYQTYLPLDLAVNSLGDLWVGSYGSIMLNNQNTWDVYNIGNSAFTSENHEQLAISDNDEVFIGTREGTLVHFDGNVWEERVNAQLPTTYGARASDIRVTSNNTAFVSHFQYGVSEFRTSTLEYHDQLMDSCGGTYCDGTTDLVFTPNSNLLAGRRYTHSSDSCIVLQFDGTDWSEYHESDFMLPEECNAMEYDPSGRLWIGDNSGLHVYDGVSWYHYDRTNSKILAGINEISITDNGVVWAVDWSPGMTLYRITLPDPEGIEEAMFIDNKVYPNPNNGHFTIEAEAFSGKSGQLSIYDLRGARVYNQPVSISSTIQVTADLTPGLFFYVLDTEEKTQRGKILIRE